MNVRDQMHHAAASSRTAASQSARWFSGLSRHGVIAAERFAQKRTTRTTARQTASLLMGSTLIGLGVALFVHGRLGVPAYDVMLTAIRDRLGISLGQAAWLFTGILMLIATALGRRPRLSGLLWVFANGVSVDVFMALIRDPDQLGVRMVFVLLGTISIASGAALVVHAGLTGGAIELLMNAAEDRGRDPFVMRRWLEIGIVALGVALGGDLGPATVFFVLTMSPLLKAGRQALEDHRRGRAERLRPIWD